MDQYKDSKSYCIHPVKCHKYQSIISVCHRCRKSLCRWNQIWSQHRKVYVTTNPIGDSASSIQSDNCASSKCIRNGIVNWNVWPTIRKLNVAAWNFRCQVNEHFFAYSVKIWFDLNSQCINVVYLPIPCRAHVHTYQQEIEIQKYAEQPIFNATTKLKINYSNKISLKAYQQQLQFAKDVIVCQHVHR